MDQMSAPTGKIDPSLVGRMEETSSRLLAALARHLVLVEITPETYSAAVRSHKNICEAAAHIQSQAERLREVEGALARAATYLDEMHSNQMRNDVDMLLDECEGPSAVAEELRALLNSPPRGASR